MKNNIKILSLLIMTALLFCLTGCENHQTPDILSENLEITVFQPVQPPENGWSMEELMNVTYLCGRQLKFPLTLNDLGENFSIDDSEKVVLKDNVTVQLKYNDKNVCSIIYKEDDVKENYQNAEIFSMTFHQFFTDDFDCLSINGITLGSVPTDVQKNLGQPDPNEKYHYNNPENEKPLLTLLFNENNQVNHIQFFMQNAY